MKLSTLISSSLLGCLVVVQGFTPLTHTAGGVRSYMTKPLSVSFLDQDGEIAELLKKEQEKEEKVLTAEQMILLQSVQVEEEQQQDNIFAPAMMDMAKPQDSLFEPPDNIYSSYYNGQYNDDAALAVGVFLLSAVSYLLTIYVPIALSCHATWV